MSDNAIEIQSLVKKFGDVAVVDIEHLIVHKGEMIGILGPNGAGKSTTIHMIMGLLAPTSGNILYNGQATYKKGLLGFVPQDIALYPELNAIDNLTFFGSLYSSQLDLKKRIKDLLQLVGLEDKAKETIKSYSGGMKRRINIAAALLHNPEIIFMDEPTVGIDPQSRNKIYEIIQHLKLQQKTIIYTTHYMEEVERMCDDVVIIDHGKKIEEGSVQSLISKLEKGILDITISSAENSEQVKVILSKIEKVVLANSEQNRYSLILKDEPQQLTSKVLQSLSEEKIQIIDFSYSRPNLETLFLLLTGKALREN